MKLRSVWRTKQILTFSGTEAHYYYTNEEYTAFKNSGFKVDHFQRVFVLTTFNFNSPPYSSIFPPF